MTPSVTWPVLEAEARALVAGAAEEGLTLRVVGSAGIRLHCERCAAGMDAVGRRAKDVDLVCRARDRRGVRALLEADGYETDRDLLVATEGRRLSFSHPERAIEIDLFVERLEFCHTIELGDRLQRHPITLASEDLLLSKLQVHDVTTNDLIDASLLLGAHAVAHEGPDSLDGPYVAQLLSRDWGFHRSVTQNLEQVGRSAISGVLARADPGLAERVPQRAGELRAAIDAARKSLAWRTRARVGERMQWWQDVNEREATY
jgi:hypothetical protein